MDINLVRQVMDAFRDAGRLSSILPTPPPPLTPLHIHMIDHIQRHTENGKPARLSDLSSELSIALPGITRAVKTLESDQYIRRVPDPNDRRATHLELTSKGKACYDLYVQVALTEIGKIWSNLPDRDVRTTVRMIKRMDYDLTEWLKNHPVKVVQHPEKN